MFLISISIFILGVIILASALAFCNRKNLSNNSNQNAKEDKSKSLDNKKKIRKNVNYIPVIHDKAIPGLGKSEIVHFVGKGELYKVDNVFGDKTKEIDFSSLNPEISGNLVLTTKNILVFSDSDVKKIPIYFIDSFYFNDINLILKRKSSKKKRDILKVLTGVEEFKYIFNALR